MGVATWNGRLVLIDDSVPTTSTQTDAGTAGVYTLTVTGAGGIGDKISFDGIEFSRFVATVECIIATLKIALLSPAAF